MIDQATWMGRPIETMQSDELKAALKAALRLLRSAELRSFVRPGLEIHETPGKTVVGRTFNWAFIPAGHLWSEDDRREVQARLDVFAAGHGLPGARVRFDQDRLEIDVPCRLGAEQLVALQEWLENEKDALDVGQVP
jgi:hypothetical protein